MELMKKVCVCVCACMSVSYLLHCTQVLKQEVADRKPIVDRLNKTGTALVAMCGSKGAEQVQSMLDDDNRRMDNVRTKVRDRSNSIDQAMQQSAEVLIVVL